MWVLGLLSNDGVDSIDLHIHLKVAMQLSATRQLLSHYNSDRKSRLY